MRNYEVQHKGITLAASDDLTWLGTQRKRFSRRYAKPLGEFKLKVNSPQVVTQGVLGRNNLLLRVA